MALASRAHERPPSRCVPSVPSVTMATCELAHLALPGFRAAHHAHHAIRRVEAGADPAQQAPPARACPCWGGGEDTLPPGERVCDLAGLSYTGNPLEPNVISYD